MRCELARPSLGRPPRPFIKTINNNGQSLAGETREFYPPKAILAGGNLRFKLGFANDRAHHSAEICVSFMSLTLNGAKDVAIVSHHHTVRVRAVINIIFIIFLNFTTKNNNT